MTLRDQAVTIVEKLRAKPRLLYEIQGLIGNQKPVLSSWHQEPDRTWWRTSGDGHVLVKVYPTQSDRWTWEVRDSGGGLQIEESGIQGSDRAKAKADAWLHSIGCILLEDV